MRIVVGALTMAAAGVEPEHGKKMGGIQVQDEGRM
jgi:hypothetical protein